MRSKSLWCATKDARGFENVWDQGSIDTKELRECFRTVAENRGTVATGHLRGAALPAVIDLAIGEGVECIVLNHPDSDSVETIVERIRLTGVGKNCISTDLGRNGAPLPWEGLLSWCSILRDRGFPPAEIETMGKSNPENLFFA